MVKLTSLNNRRVPLRSARLAKVSMEYLPDWIKQMITSIGLC
jgi:hypothetical protein